MPPRKSTAAANPTKGLADGIKCLQWILAQRGPVALRDLAAGLDLETTRAFRLVKTLLQEGLLRQTHGRKYEIGPATYSLTAQTLHSSHLIEAALPPLESMRRTLPYRVALGTLWGKKVSYLYHGEKKTPIEKAIGGAPQWDATNSGVGLAVLAQQCDEEVRATYEGHPIPNFPEGIDALLASLAEIRTRGYAYTSITGAGWQGAQYTIALTLPSNETTAIALAGRINPNDVTGLVTLLRTAVTQIEQSLYPGLQASPHKMLEKGYARSAV